MIAYGICGEGRGHASRALTVVERFAGDREFLLFAARDAYHFLQSHYEHTPNVTVREIPGLHFQYIVRRISYVKSFLGSLPFLLQLRRYTSLIKSEIKARSCELVISDFEPLTARAANQLSIPLATLDHQSFIRYMDLGDLSPLHKLKTMLMRPFVALHYDGSPDTSIVSSFFCQRLQPNAKICNTGVLIRSQILDQRPSVGNYLLVYLRKHRMEELTRLLSGLGRRVVIYSSNPPADFGNLEFRKIGKASFCEDLANCEGLICNAGNQLVGEALYLRKPVLAIPEPGNHEQWLNGHFLDGMDVGVCVPHDQLNQQRLQDFLDRIPDFRAAINPSHYVGNQQIFEQLGAMLPTSQPAALADPCEAITASSHAA